MVYTAAVHFLFEILESFWPTYADPWVGNQLSDKIKAFDITAEPIAKLTAKAATTERGPPKGMENGSF